MEEITKVMPVMDENFPIICYTKAFDKKDDDLIIHFEKEVKFIYCNTGLIEYTINGESYQLKKGDMLLINPRQVYQAKALSEEPIINNVIIFDYEMLKPCNIDAVNEDYILPLINSQILFNNVIRKDSLGYIEIKLTLKKIYDCVTYKKPGFELRFKSLAFELLYQLFGYNLYSKNKTYIKKTEKDTYDPIRDSIDYINANYKHKLSLDELSDAVKLSKFHLCRQFKDSTGITINHYLNNRRVFEAAKLLKESKKEISTIGYEVGFNNPSYFISQFKKVYGLTPRKFRDAN